MQQIIRHLFKADTLEEVPRERLEELVEEYPSFSIARYLLSSKLRAEHADNFTEETHRTNLYFTNPLWLHWLLQDKAEESPAVADTAVIAMGEIVEHAGTPPWEEAVAQPVGEQSVEPVGEQSVEPVGEQPVAPVGEPVKEPLAVPTAEPYAPGEAWAETQRAEASPEPQTIEPQVEDVPVLAQMAEMPAEPEEEPQLVFQSYHTIDYFASQGIKFSVEDNPSDRLGKQMKSFTEWLKVMKRIPQKQADAMPDIIAEHKIQAIAAHSIEGREIVTETMAEVLAKQGMWEKAAEVYRKLSLLNPDKSSYFADKIEQIQARSNN